jgi:hypothetical protein
MRRQDRNFFSDGATAPAAEILAMATQQHVTRASATRGLSSHVRQSKRNQGISRWLALAVLIGSLVALAMVQFAIH